MFNKSEKSVDLCNTQGKFKGVNGENKNDRLEILKAKCEQEIRETEERLRVLKAKLANLVTLAQESEKLVNPQSEPDKYKESGLTDAVLDAVNALWEIRRIAATPLEIRNHLLAHGFKATNNFDTAIYTVLNRLCEAGKITWGHTRAQTFGQIGVGLIRRKVYRPIHK